MKKLFILLFPVVLTILSCTQNQTEYQVVVRPTGNALVDKMYLASYLELKVDSAILKNGVYEFSGLCAEPQLCLVFTKDNAHLGKSFVLENGKTSIKGDISNLSEADISCENNANNELYQNFTTQFFEYEGQVRRLSSNLKRVKENNDTIQIKSCLDSLNILAQNQRKIIYSLLENHPDNAGIAIAISRELLPREYLKTDEFVKAYEMYSQNLKESFSGLKLKEYIDDQISPPMKIGEQVIDFTLENTEKESVSISDFRGNYVLVDFWASWCSPCRAENPNLKRVYDTYNKRGFEIVGIALDSDREAWEMAIEKDSLNWTNLSELKGWKSEVAQKYKIKSIPTNMLLDTTGRIIAVNLRGDALQRKLEEIFDK